jgi:hypothetical protein
MDYRTVTPAPPRGIRDNNPGNLTPPPGLTNWQGAVGADGPFVIFSDTTWGLRALALDLINSINGNSTTPANDTIQTLITNYSTTDQAAYVANVATFTGIDPSTQLGTDQDTITSIMRAIVNQENGAPASAQYIADADLVTGYQMATNQSVAQSFRPQ